jgi:putative PIN family toxin of toxin-antitoxin system
MTRPVRVVLDTNLILSALVFSSGRLAAIRVAWQEARFQPLVSKASATELLRVLAYPKFKLSPGEREDLIGDYLPYCVAVRTPAKPPAVPQCRDPFDAPFLHLALVGKAEYLVTGDRDLLSLVPKFLVPIVTADAFLSIIDAKRAQADRDA